MSNTNTEVSVTVFTACECKTDSITEIFRKAKGQPAVHMNVCSRCGAYVNSRHLHGFSSTDLARWRERSKAERHARERKQGVRV